MGLDLVSGPRGYRGGRLTWSPDEVEASREAERKSIEIARALARGNGCPNCGAVLVKRTNSVTGEIFLGCSMYAVTRCRGSRQVHL